MVVDRGFGVGIGDPEVDIAIIRIPREHDARLDGQVLLQPSVYALRSTATRHNGAIVSPRGASLDLSRVDARLQKNLPVQTRVVLTWDANDCDIDLWVADPNAETAIYDHPRTYQGGRMSRDFTAGYGPEEFLLRSPKPGTYRVKINYYADHRQTDLGRSRRRCA